MKLEDTVLIGGIAAAIILALWYFMKEKQGISGEIEGETTITVEPIT